jgi:hypothetical protein
MIWGGALLTLFYLFAFATNATPYLRGPEAWRWAYAIPGKPWRHLVPAAVVTAYVVVVVLWLRRLRWVQENSANLRISKSEIGFLLFVALAIPLIQAALLFPESPDILRPLFYRTVSVGASGVFTVGSTITDPVDFLRHYPARMLTFPVHPQRYPPGLPLLFYGTRRLFEASSALSDPLGLGLRLYQCHDFALMRLSNATIATALLQMALPVITGLIVFPLYGLARRTIGRPAAAWAVIFYPLVPSFALWSARWDQFYPLLTCAAWYCFWRGLQEARCKSTSCILPLASFLTRHTWLLLSGLLLSITTFLSFGPLVMLAPMGLAAALWVLPHPDRRRWGALAVDTLVFFAGLVLPWLVYQLVFGNGFLDIWRVSMAYHLGLGRDYGVWLFYHLYDFFAFLGLPLALLFVAGLIMVLRGGLKDARIALPLGFGLGLLLLDLSGTARGEVARVWLFLTPFAVIGAAYGLSHLTHRRWPTVIVIALLSAQLLVFNVFLRVVTTGITDPPVFTRIPSAHATTIDARFGEQIALVAYEITPDNVQPGATLTVTLTWRAIAQMPRPYTVFVHLLGPDGNLVAQHDGIPQHDNAPTTCWRPGDLIPDPHPLTLPTNVVPGEYTLITGLYFWETGERLPARGATATPDNIVRVTSIDVQGGNP